MHIDITSKKINFLNGEKFNLNNNEYIVIFYSPNHSSKYSLSDFLKKPKESFTDIIYNDSFLYVKNNKIEIFRDWPGNVQFFYYSNKNRFIISDDISNIAKKEEDIELSKKGIKLFLFERKHFHSHTIFKNVELLHPGSKLVLDLTNLKEFKVEYWYKPYMPITKKKYDESKYHYLNAIDKNLLKTIPKDYDLALMFSGGSDSTFLLSRFQKLGYKKLRLFTICPSNDKRIYNFASKSAKKYGYPVYPLNVDKVNAIDDWLEVQHLCYHYLSDLRIDGMLSSSKSLLLELKKIYNGNKLLIIWGSQYSLISPSVTTKSIFLKFIPITFFNKIVKRFKFLEKKANRMTLSLIRSHMLQENLMNRESYNSFKNLYIKAFSEITNKDELINLFLSTDYNHLKHWWMDWRFKLSNHYYPNAQNIYPFHDRLFQEKSMPISLKVRIGGLKNYFNMPNSYKYFFYSLFESSSFIKEISGDNARGRPAYQSLFRNKKYYDVIQKYFTNKKYSKFIEFVENELGIYPPKTVLHLQKMDFQEVEKISGIIFIINKFKKDKIKF